MLLSLSYHCLQQKDKRAVCLPSATPSSPSPHPRLFSGLTSSKAVVPGVPTAGVSMAPVGPEGIPAAGNNAEGGRRAEPLGMLVWMEAAASDKADS